MVENRNLQAKFDQVSNELELIQTSKDMILGDALLELEFLDEKTLYKGLEYFFNVPYVDLKETSFNREAVSLIPEYLAKKHEIILIKKDSQFLTLAMHDPVNFYAIDDVENLVDQAVKVVITPKKDILNAIDRIVDAFPPYQQQQNQYQAGDGVHGLFFGRPSQAGYYQPGGGEIPLCGSGGF